MEDALSLEMQDDRNMKAGIPSEAEHEDETEYGKAVEGITDVSSMTGEQRSKLAIFTVVAVMSEVAAVAIIQLLGIYWYGVDFLEAVTTRVGWSAYSSGLGIGFALLLMATAFYAHIQGIDLNGWPGFSSGLSRICAAMLVETPLLGQVNTYTAMCKGLGAGVENASLVGSKISEALVSTIVGYIAFSVLLVVYMFAIRRKGDSDEGA